MQVLSKFLTIVIVAIAASASAQSESLGANNSRTQRQRVAEIVNAMAVTNCVALQVVANCQDLARTQGAYRTDRRNCQTDPEIVPPNNNDLRNQLGCAHGLANFGWDTARGVVFDLPRAIWSSLSQNERNQQVTSCMANPQCISGLQIAARNPALANLRSLTRAQVEQLFSDVEQIQRQAERRRIMQDGVAWRYGMELRSRFTEFSPQWYAALADRYPEYAARIRANRSRPPPPTPFEELRRTMTREMVCLTPQAATRRACYVAAFVGTLFVGGEAGVAPRAATNGGRALRGLASSAPLRTETGAAATLERTTPLATRRPANRETARSQTNPIADIPAYSAGVAEADRLVELGRTLRARGIDPARTHVPEFAAQLDDSFTFAENAIRSQGFEVEERLAILRQFRAEAAARRTSGVTYRYWGILNYRLSILMTRSTSRFGLRAESALSQQMLRDGSWLTHDGMEALYSQYQGRYHFGAELDRFPQTVVLPSTRDLGIAAINRMTGTDTYVVGLAPRYQVVDDIGMHPDAFFLHDIGHLSVDQDTMVSREISLAQRTALRQRYLRISAQTTDPLDRQALEFAYFYVGHERPVALYDMTVGGRGRRVLAESPVRYRLSRSEDMASLLPPGVTPQDFAARAQRQLNRLVP